jgi:hypothetical protein
LVFPSQIIHWAPPHGQALRPSPLIAGVRAEWETIS